MSTSPRRRGGSPLTPSPSIQQLADAWGLTTNHNILEGESFAFVRQPVRPDVSFGAALPCVAHEDSVYFVVPANAVPADRYKLESAIVDAAVFANGVAYLGPDEFPTDNAEIVAALDTYRATLVAREQQEQAADKDGARKREAQEILADARAHRGICASAAYVADETPQLVKGLGPDNAVWVMFGRRDEFKTTFASYLAGCVSAGTLLLGMEVPHPRPVIWYCLEGKNEIPGRLRAINASLKRHGTLWGDFDPPVAMHDSIPKDDYAWRQQIAEDIYEFEKLAWARKISGGISDKYPAVGRNERPPLIVIDTLSLWLGSDSDIGPAATNAINRCLNLLKRDDDPRCRGSWDARAPVASGAIILHHTTKAGDVFAGHGSIGNNSNALYRVTRSGKSGDRPRSMIGLITPERTKDMDLPAPLRFEVEKVPVPGTAGRHTVVLKDNATEVPADLEPIVALIRALPLGELSLEEVNDRIDEFTGEPEASADEKSSSKFRMARKRSRDKCRDRLVAAGVLEFVPDDDGNLLHYIFRDPA